MRYMIQATLDINNDEVDQPHPTRDEIIASLYEGRLTPEGIIFNIVDLEVDTF